MIYFQSNAVLYLSANIQCELIYLRRNLGKSICPVSRVPGRPYDRLSEILPDGPHRAVASAAQRKSVSESITRKHFDKGILEVGHELIISVNRIESDILVIIHRKEIRIKVPVGNPVNMREPQAKSLTQAVNCLRRLLRKVKFLRHDIFERRSLKAHQVNGNSVLSGNRGRERYRILISGRKRRAVPAQ